jgi:hypothetical protein
MILNLLEREFDPVASDHFDKNFRYSVQFR